MIRGVLGSPASIGGVLGSGRGGAAAAWYLAGGVSAANCIAAYTPKGAASLAASYDNNAAPGNGLADGTYDAAPGVAPTFDTATGWTFNGSSQYLTTGITPATNYSIIARFSNVANGGSVMGSSTNAGAGVQMYPSVGGFRYYYASAELKISGGQTAGVMAIAGYRSPATAYLNGSSDGAIGAGASGSELPMNIGALRYGTPVTIAYINAKIQAVAIYNVTLDAATVAAISAAMAAL